MHGSRGALTGWHLYGKFERLEGEYHLIADALKRLEEQAGPVPRAEVDRLKGRLDQVERRLGEIERKIAGPADR